MFIVDKTTMSILGNSFGAMTYAQDPSNPSNKVDCNSIWNSFTNIHRRLSSYVFQPWSHYIGYKCVVQWWSMIVTYFV